MTFYPCSWDGRLSIMFCKTYPRVLHDLQPQGSHASLTSVRLTPYPYCIPQRKLFLFQLFPQESWFPSSRCSPYINPRWELTPFLEASISHLLSSSWLPHQSAFVLEVLVPSWGASYPCGLDSLLKMPLSLRSRFPPWRSFSLEFVIPSSMCFHHWGPNSLLVVP